MKSLPSDEQVISATFNGQLAVGAGMIALCVIIHGIGLFTLHHAMLKGHARERLEDYSALSIRGAFVTLTVVFSLFFIHFVEIWSFAFLYDYLGALASFQEALYFSTVTYSTLGYNDDAIAEEWRMVAAIEGVLGVILLGWSTAFFVQVLGRLQGGRHGPSDASGEGSEG